MRMEGQHKLVVVVAAALRARLVQQNLQAVPAGPQMPESALVVVAGRAALMVPVLRRLPAAVVAAVRAAVLPALLILPQLAAITFLEVAAVPAGVRPERMAAVAAAARRL